MLWSSSGRASSGCRHAAPFLLVDDDLDFADVEGVLESAGLHDPLTVYLSETLGGLVGLGDPSIWPPAGDPKDLIAADQEPGLPYLGHDREDT